MLLLNVLAFIVIWILARWLIGLFGKGLSSAADQLGMGPLDHMGGLALGVVQTALMMAIGLGLALPLLTASTFSGLSDIINSQSLLAPPLISAFYWVMPWLRQIGQTVWERIR